MDEMSKNMSFEYPEKPKFREQETGHVYFKEGVDESTEPFAKNVKLAAHTEYTSHKNGKIGEGGGGSDAVLSALIDKSITELTTPESCTSIGNDALSECTSLATVDMPNVTSIGEYAFSRCTSLATVNMPNVTSIGNGAFSRCTSLATVDMPNVTSIGSSAFSGISSSAVINIGAAEGEISGAPWGAPNGVTINYNVRPAQEG